MDGQFAIVNAFERVKPVDASTLLTVVLGSAVVSAVVSQLFELARDKQQRDFELKREERQREEDKRRQQVERDLKTFDELQRVLQELSTGTLLMQGLWEARARALASPSEPQIPQALRDQTATWFNQSADAARRLGVLRTRISDPELQKRLHEFLAGWQQFRAAREDSDASPDVSMDAAMNLIAHLQAANNRVGQLYQNLDREAPVQSKELVS
jgi:hypothetical protein